MCLKSWGIISNIEEEESIIKEASIKENIKEARFII